MRRLLLGCVVVAAVLAPTAAWAHPLGNFTTNTADQVVVVADGVEVTHVIDLAEIPTVQLRERADTDGTAGLSPAELTAYAASECAAVRPRLLLVVDGSAAPLTLEASSGERSKSPTRRTVPPRRAVAFVIRMPQGIET